MRQVAPYMGAWIETDINPLPCYHSYVAPYMGAWIETDDRDASIDQRKGRSLHGGVD